MGSWFNTVTKATIPWSGAILAGACDPRSWWGGPPGPQPAPWPACPQSDQVDFIGEERDQGVRPTITGRQAKLDLLAGGAGRQRLFPAVGCLDGLLYRQQEAVAA